MSSRYRAFALFCASTLSYLFFSNAAKAQEALPDIVVTATRTPQPLATTASTINVITAEDIERHGATGLKDVLDATPGVSVYSTGGVGAATSISLRGSNPGQTLVLIDGIRIGDPSQVDGAVDLGSFPSNNIERIEVLRGPQSALYGSDAMGGVINIITKSGQSGNHGALSLEAGSYGTLHSRFDQSAGFGPWSLTASADALYTQGFPQYGYRLSTPAPWSGGSITTLPANEPASRGGASARLRYKPDNDFSIDLGLNANGSNIQFDNPYASVYSNVYNSYNQQGTTFLQGFAALNANSFGGMLHNKLTIFSNSIKRDIWQTEGCYNSNTFASDNCDTSYQGGRMGSEYQGDLKLGRIGLLTLGGRIENETASINYIPNPDPTSNIPVSATQTTYSVFGQHQFTVLNRLDLSYGGRLDQLDSNPAFATGRATAAFRIDESATKLRASIGTGEKNASLYERFSQYGTANLLPEQSTGWDFGLDQKLGSRVALSATYFNNDYSNLISWGNVASCTAVQAGLGGCYYNVNQAHTDGVELAMEATLAPNKLRLRGTYTHLNAQNISAGTPLYRRPPDQGNVSAIFSGLDRFELEAKMKIVGPTADYDFIDGVAVTLPAYLKADISASYRLRDNVTIFGRIENLTDVQYQEAFGYSTAGRSYYAGAKFSW